MINSLPWFKIKINFFNLRIIFYKLIVKSKLKNTNIKNFNLLLVEYVKKSRIVNCLIEINFSKYWIFIFTTIVSNSQNSKNL